MSIDFEKKKRGRPKKLLNDDMDNNGPNEQLILKLPIKNIGKKLSKQETNTNVDDSCTLNISDSSFDNVKPKHKHISGDDLNKKDEQINQLVQKVNDLEDQLKEFSNYNRKITPMKTNLIDIDGKEIRFNKTDVCCWWCTEKFDNEPIFLPFKFNDQGYHVYGIFCSFNCACAYNNNETHDFKKHERHSLLLKMYEEMYGTSKEITESPSRYVLKKYGGNITINQYRNNLILGNKDYRIYVPPLLPVVPKIEEDYNDKTIIKENIFGKVKEKQGLRLKRSKPLANTKVNLFDVMNLTGNKKHK